jgi:hypothetical protein
MSRGEQHIDKVGRWSVYAAAFGITYGKSTAKSIAKKLREAADELDQYGDEWHDWDLNYFPHVGYTVYKFIGHREATKEELEAHRDKSKEKELESLRKQASVLKQQIKKLEGD